MSLLFQAPGSVVRGNVKIGKDCSLWFNGVIRSESAAIQIGDQTNIQDNCTLHTDPGHDLIVGREVTVGHNAILHGCHIDDHCLIGMGAIVMNGARISKDSIVAAGALVPENKSYEPGMLIMGVPAKAVRPLTPQEIQSISENAAHYVQAAQDYAAGKIQ